MLQILAWAHGHEGGGAAAFLMLVAFVLLVAAMLGSMSRENGYDRD